MRRLLWTPLVVALVLGATPSTAAPARELVLSGTGAASVDVVLAGRARLDLAALVTDPRAAWSGLAVLDGRGVVRGLSLNVDRWTRGAEPFFTPRPIVLSDRLDLSPGRYRLVLLASGPATVRVPATGALAGAFRASRPVPGEPVRLTDLTPQLPAPVEHVTDDVAVRPGGVALLAVHLRATAHQASTPELCFRVVESGDDCLTSLGSRNVFASPGSVGDGYAQSWYVVYGDLSAGVYETRSRDVVVDRPAVLDELLVVL